MQVLNFIVYMATNTVNGKRYIGATSQKLRKRQIHHQNSAKSKDPGCPVFHAAIRKYGAQSFIWSVIETLSSFQEMLEREISLIAELQPEYNISRGGEGALGVKMSAESRAKIAAVRSVPVICVTDGKEYPNSILAAEQYGVSPLRIRAACKTGGIVAGVHRFRLSDGELVNPEWLSKQGANRRKKRLALLIMRAIDATRVPVVCLNNGRKFRSITEAATAFDVPPAALSLSLRRGQRCMGYYFIRSKTVPAVTRRRKMMAALDAERFDRLSKRKSLSVVCSDNTLYRNARCAAEAHNLSEIRIGQICRYGGTTRSGLSFSYMGAS